MSSSPSRFYDRDDHRARSSFGYRDDRRHRDGRLRENRDRYDGRREYDDDDPYRSDPYRSDPFRHEGRRRRRYDNREEGRSMEGGRRDDRYHDFGPPERRREDFRRDPSASPPPPPPSPSRVEYARRDRRYEDNRNREIIRRELERSRSFEDYPGRRDYNRHDELRPIEFREYVHDRDRAPREYNWGPRNYDRSPPHPEREYSRGRSRERDRFSLRDDRPRVYGRGLSREFIHDAPISREERRTQSSFPQRGYNREHDRRLPLRDHDRRDHDRRDYDRRIALAPMDLDRASDQFMGQYGRKPGAVECLSSNGSDPSRHIDRPSNRKTKASQSPNKHSKGQQHQQGSMSRGGPFNAFRRKEPVDIGDEPDTLTNVLLADITPNFHFFRYGIDCRDKNGKSIESINRRNTLFRIAFNEVLTKWMPDKERDRLERQCFFLGTYLFSAGELPGLQEENLPEILVDGFSHYTDGDTLRVTKVVCHTAPEVLFEDNETTPSELKTATPGKPAEGSKGSEETGQVEKKDENLDVRAAEKIRKNGTKNVPAEAESEARLEGSTGVSHQQTPAVSDEDKESDQVAYADTRCKQCVTAFESMRSLLAHCRATGHSPVYKPTNAKPCNYETFLAYVNTALQRAFSERMARWGRAYIDPKSYHEPKDKNGKYVGVRVFRAYCAEFSIYRIRPEDKPLLSLTVDVRARVIRTKSVLESIYDGRDPNRYHFTKEEIDDLKKSWIGETVISKKDKTCHIIHDLLFDETPRSLPVGDLGMSHEEYCRERKQIELEFPNATPMLAVVGRHKQIIFLPPEIVCGNELDSHVKKKLPNIAGFRPHERNQGIEEVKRYLIPGAQKSKGRGGGLLPGLGIVLRDERVVLKATVLPTPAISSGGVQIPKEKLDNWSMSVDKAVFLAEPNTRVKMNPVVIYHHSIDWLPFYKKLAHAVNHFSSKYYFPMEPFASVSAGDDVHHWNAVQKFLEKDQKKPENLFFVDFTKPRGLLDPAYHTVKHMFASCGYLSQFINFKNCHHDHPRGKQEKWRSQLVTISVARQILHKCGVATWWITLPKSIPMPAMFVGVDVFHSARSYNPATRSRMGTNSCAAIIVQFVHSHEASETTFYTQTWKRVAGQEDELGVAMEETVRNALQTVDMKPKACIVWRDGVGESSIKKTLGEELSGLMRGLSLSCERNDGGGGKRAKTSVPVAFMFCQKRIATKLLYVSGGRAYGMPPGTYVEGLQEVRFKSAFYINGISPPVSTPKPVRFVLAHLDEELVGAPLAELSWAMCHCYPNWPGPIKVPSVCQMAHKLAEFAGSLPDNGDSIDHKLYANTLYFL